MGGCEGQGEWAQQSGELFLRGCPAQEGGAGPGMPVPMPLPGFALEPTFFAAEPIHPFRPDMEPRGVERMKIRLQRSPHRPELADGLTFYITSYRAVPEDTQEGRREIPLHQALSIVPPPIDRPESPFVPLPTDPEGRVRAALTLFATCPFALAQPLVSGTITFVALGFARGDLVEASFELSFEDARKRRQSVPAAPSEDLDVAGRLSGWFRTRVKAGVASTYP